MPFTLTPATAFERGARARWRVAVEIRWDGDVVVPRPADAATGPGRADVPRAPPVRGVARGAPARVPAAGFCLSSLASFSGARIGPAGGFFSDAASLPRLAAPRIDGVTTAGASTCFGERRVAVGVLRLGTTGVALTLAAGALRPARFDAARGTGATAFFAGFAIALPAGLPPLAFAAPAFFFAGLGAAFAGLGAAIFFDGLVAFAGFVGFSDLAALTGFNGLVAFEGFVGFSDLAALTGFDGLVAFEGFVGFSDLAALTGFNGLVAFEGFVAAATFFAAPFFCAAAREDVASVIDAAALPLFTFAAATSLVLRLSLAAFFFVSRFDFPAMVSLFTSMMQERLNEFLIGNSRCLVRNSYFSREANWHSPLRSSPRVVFQK